MEAHPGQAPPASLRELAGRRAYDEVCELCGKPIAEEHSHLVEPAGHKLVCSCRPCALLFSRPAQTRYLLVPPTGRVLADFAIPEDLWAGLMIPVDMAYFFKSTQAGRVVALYPSPAGATESLLTLETWQQVQQSHRALREMRADVEGLLVCRIGSQHEYFIAPVDRFYELVGIIKTTWRGFSGGPDVWSAIRAYFDRLRAISAAEPAEAAEAT